MELAIKNLTKRYKTKLALSEASLTLTPGIYGLLGPNGAGKSTLMNIIAGNVPATSGEILLDGKDIFSMHKEFRGLLGFMPQQQNIYADFTADRFLSYMAALKKMKSADAKREIEELLDVVNLKSDRRRKLGTFSGGMKQRILIAQALLNHPQIVILDEPTAGLDPKERIRIRNMIAKIALNRIIIIATHVVSDVEYIAKEIILLKDGNVVACEKPDELERNIQEKVYEIEAAEEDLPSIEAKWPVANIAAHGDKIVVRVLAESPPEPYQWRYAAPTLEDVYLYTFGLE